MNKLEIDLKEFWPLINETISSGGEFRLYHKGKSMMPLLREGIDSVILVAPTDIKKNDIVLYVRNSGQFVMHRVVKLKGDNYIMCGDNQALLEKGITKENILAKVKGIYRGDIYCDLTDKKYKRYVRGLPFRRAKISFLWKINN